MEVANAQYTSAPSGIQHQMEREPLTLQLQLASQNMALVGRESNVARDENEALIIYKLRLMELLDGLRKRDVHHVIRFIGYSDF